MRIQRKRNSAAEEAVMMSPLIDCVFLLLIFFLATSQIKRWERQIPVTLADPSASLSLESRSDAYYLGVDEAGNIYHESGKSSNGVTLFSPVENLEVFLSELIAERGGSAPVELVVEKETPFQTVIDVLDTLQHQGLQEVRSRIRHGKISRGDDA
ncbi:MAG: biopolymer transporter ExbD [Opitutales bacterium]